MATFNINNDSIVNFAAHSLKTRWGESNASEFENYQYSGSFSSLANPTYSFANIPGGTITGISFNEFLSITGLNIKTSTFLKYFLDDAGQLEFRGDFISYLFKGNDIINLNTNYLITSNVSGLAGNDVITSGASSDRIFGGVGNDQLIGGSGDDWLSGEKGKDTLTGDLGSDYFCFDYYTPLSPSNTDRITDFQPGIDFLVFDVRVNSVFEDLGGDNFFIALSGASKAKNGEQLIYDTKNGNLFFDADGAGTGGKGILIATFTGIPTITEDDIFFGEVPHWS